MEGKTQARLRITELLLRWQEDMIKRTKRGVFSTPDDIDLLSDEIDGLLTEISDTPAETGAAQTELSGKEGSSSAGKHGRRRVAHSVFSLAFYLVLIVLVVGAQSLFGGNAGPRVLFNYTALNVLTDSMQREIPQNSLVIVHRVDPNTIQVGDNVTYMSNQKVSVTHKVVGIIENFEDTGQRGFQTKGVENRSPDRKIVYAVNVVGKVVYHVPAVGAAIAWANGNILLLLIVVIGMGGLLFSLYKTLRWLFRPDAPKETIDDGRLTMDDEETETKPRRGKQKRSKQGEEKN